MAISPTRRAFGAGFWQALLILRKTLWLLFVSYRPALLPLCTCLTALCLLLTAPMAAAQLSRPQPPGEIYLSLQKLNVLGSTLYLSLIHI